MYTLAVRRQNVSRAHARESVAHLVEKKTADNGGDSEAGINAVRGDRGLFSVRLANPIFSVGRAEMHRVVFVV